MFSECDFSSTAFAVLFPLWPVVEAVSKVIHSYTVSILTTVIGSFWDQYQVLLGNHTDSQLIPSPSTKDLNYCDLTLNISLL